MRAGKPIWFFSHFFFWQHQSHTKEEQNSKKHFVLISKPAMTKIQTLVPSLKVVLPSTETGGCLQTMLQIRAWDFVHQCHQCYTSTLLDGLLRFSWSAIGQRSSGRTARNPGRKNDNCELERIFSVSRFLTCHLLVSTYPKVMRLTNRQIGTRAITEDTYLRL